MGLLGDLTNVGFDSVQAKILATAIGGGGGSATWGDIVGSLSNQTDLQNALNAKADLLSLAIVAMSGDYDDLIDKPFYNGAELNKNNPNFYGTSSSAATDVTKIVSIPSITKLETGQVIIIKPDNTSTVANTKIQLNSFTAYPMRYNGSAITTSTDSIVWNANYPTLWLFDGTYWVFLAHGVDSNTTYTLNYSIDAGQYVAGSGSYAITRYSLILQKPNQTWEKVTATSSTYSTGTSKTANTNGFLLGQIRYYSSTTTLANGAKAATNVVYNKSSSIDLRYSTNCGGTPAWTAGEYIYLVGSIGVDGLFYLDTTKWWDNALPTTNDGKLYIRLGIVITDSSYSISLLEDRPIFYHDGVSLRQYGKADNKQDLITANNKLDYSLIANTPSIPTVNNATLTIQKNSSNVGTFTANASSNVTIDISVPTDTNDLTNGAGYITSNDIPALPSDTDLSHYDNSTSDFVDSNALATKQDVIDNNNPLSASYITGLATVATSGDYDDLLNKPTIPTVNDATLTIQRNSTNIGTFTANASSNATIDITVPTDTNDLTNGAGYITGVSSINDIGDVTITTPSAGELLKYDGSKWVNGSPSTSVTNWGDILGSLSNQTDLQNALNDKQNVIDANNKLDYSLLSNTPTIPTVNDATLTLQQNGTTVGTFTANASTNNTLNFSDTNTTSGITVNSSLVPNTDNTYDLGGSPSNYWKTTYSKNYYGTFIGDSSDGMQAIHLRFPSSQNPSTGDYGITNDSGYLALSGRGGTYGGIQVWGLNNVELGGWTALGIRPGADNTYDLGANGLAWRDGWFYRKLYLKSSSAYLEAGTTLNDIGLFWSSGGYGVTGYHGNFMPCANNTLQLGADGYRWKQLFAVSSTISTSDRRAKENIEDLENALEKLNTIGVKSYTMKGFDKHINYGFIAQDELECNPELVYVPDNYSEEEDGGYLGVVESNVLFLAVKAIQELSAKVTNLEQELKTIKGDNYGN